MLQMHTISSFSPKYHPLHQAGGCVKMFRSPAVIQLHGGVMNRSESKKYSLKSSIHLPKKFRSNNNKYDDDDSSKRNNNEHRVAVTLQNDAASSTNESDNNSTSFHDLLLKKSNALYRFIRPFTLVGTFVGITSISILPLQSFADLTPKYLMGLILTLISAVLMNTYVGTVNQLFDVEIDKVSKPYLPIASGEISMGIGIAITLTSALMSLAIAIWWLQSPPLVFGLFVWFLLGTAYSVHVPFLRWKANPFLAAMCIMTAFGLVYQFPFFIHIQKYVLGRPVIITRQLIFTAAIMCCFCIVMALLKDIPDVEGDREFGIRTLAVIIGKERVLRLCVYILTIAYGGGIIFGAASSSLHICKLVSIIGHSTLACMLWLRARTVDLNSNASTFDFYMFFWRLYHAEYLLIHFLR